MKRFYCKNCKHLINPYDYWYLKDTNLFTNRVAILGHCSNCNQKSIYIFEQRIEDSKTFEELIYGKKALRVIEHYKKYINYTYSQIKPSYTPKPRGWKYGKFIFDKKRRVYKIIRRDFNQREELIGIVKAEGNQNKILDVGLS